MPDWWPCPASEPYAQTAGIKSGLRDGMPMDGRQDNPYICRSCCCGNGRPYRSNAWYYPCCRWVD